MDKGNGSLFYFFQLIESGGVFRSQITVFLFAAGTGFRGFIADRLRGRPRKQVVDVVAGFPDFGFDGMRADVDGNLWCSSNAGRNVGYSGVTVWSPAGKLIGRIRLPEVCGNVCFGGPKRNRLFMAASQSLYAVYTGTQGAAPG